MIAATGELMKKIDGRAISQTSVFELVFRAANAVFSEIEPFCKNVKTVVLCGGGTCGADGYALADILCQNGYPCVCIDTAGKEYGNDTVKACKHVCKARILQYFEDEVKAEIADASVIVDAIYGFGFDVEREMPQSTKEIILLANRAECKRVAIDLPSGVCATTGRVASCVFKADMTVSFTLYKVGNVSYPAREYNGEVVLKDIGISFDGIQSSVHISDKDIYSYLPERKRNTHKGSFGKLLCICGSENMTGCAYLCTSGALRAGVGYCILASDKKTLRVLQSSLYECVFMPVKSRVSYIKKLIDKANECDAVLFGCGIVRSRFYKKVIEKLIENCEKQIILDADGINLICENKIILKKAKKPVILTPHPLEFSRISGYSVAEISQNRLELARAFAKEYGCILVLKGAASIITDGNVSYINSTGNAGLAKAGSGDVLAGVISSLCAQGTDPFYAAVCGVYSHGRAGDILEGELSQRGYLPQDLPKVIGGLLSLE